ncbi:MAG: hypothetical protein ACFFAE_21405 [Candidatus Hodarchaeota archaeon]
MANEKQGIFVRSFEIGGILFLAWALMLTIFILLEVFIVPLQISNGWKVFIVGAFKVGIAGTAFFLWLFTWKIAIEQYFWKRINDIS